MSSRPSMRQARLRPEFADLYPPIDPAEWIPAAVASARMLLWQTRQPGAASLGQRTLDPRHFDFRGGAVGGGAERLPGTRFGDHGESGSPLRREARLRAGFAGLYPLLPSDTWMNAAELGATLLRWVTTGGTTVKLGPRLLPEEHFEFRGGELPRGSIASPRTRRDDAPARGERAAG
ncbi:MAG TPA: hypothetical protein VMN37_02460 [Gemmatimonadales bacterium]|nr:hypothetical protein [Gemmatimonadales bacterium]